jgi:hypothetical protein
MKEMEIQIKKPNDSNEYYTTTITCNEKSVYLPSRRTVIYDMSHKDPVHAGIVKLWKEILGTRRSYFPNGRDYNIMIMIKSCPLLIGRSGNRLKLQGQFASLSTIASVLARVTYKSCFEDDPEKLMLSVYSTMNLPEDARYCLENRMPFHFYEDFEKIEVRLNCEQISDTEIAVEISDGVWGTMKVKDVQAYCNFYLRNQERGKKWKRLSPKKLYSILVGNKPTESQLKVMTAFLKQNRMGDIVEKRAMQLVDDMLTQHKDRLIPFFDNSGVLRDLVVKGKKYDWRLSYRGAGDYRRTNGRQNVSTYLLQKIRRDNQDVLEWKGPICIDNMAQGSPLGDQYAARALALMNDTHTMKIVSTIRSYIVNKNDENVRVDENVLRELRERDSE